MLSFAHTGACGVAVDNADARIVEAANEFVIGGDNEESQYAGPSGSGFVTIVPTFLGYLIGATLNSAAAGLKVRQAHCMSALSLPL